MTNALKEGEIKQIRRMHIRSLWSIRHDYEEIMLEESLIRDGRFYGAEWNEELDDWIGYCSDNINSYQV